MARPRILPGPGASSFLAYNPRLGAFPEPGLGGSPRLSLPGPVRST